MAPSAPIGSPGAIGEVYDGFGVRTGTSAQTDPFGYGGQAGYYTDAETGLILCTHRFYDPQAGRFVTRDPIGYGGGINLYGYTQNNPGNRSDPSGYYEGSGDEDPDKHPGTGDENPNDPPTNSQPPSGGYNSESGNSPYSGVPSGSGGGGSSGAGGMAQGPVTVSGDYFGPGDAPNNNIVVRGGTSPMPPPGSVFSGSHGGSIEEAAAGVPHGTIRSTTAGAIRSNGGTVTVIPEPVYENGPINYKHVNVTEGTDCPSTFSDMFPNPVLRNKRVPGRP